MEPIISIRSTEPKDYKWIYDFVCHLEETSFDPQGFKEQFLLHLEQPDYVSLVAVDDAKQILGFINAQRQRALRRPTVFYQILECYVARPMRSRGIGRQLLQALEDNLSSAGLTGLSISLSSGKAEARRYFIKQGFTHSIVQLEKSITHA